MNEQLSKTLLIEALQTSKKMIDALPDDTTSTKGIVIFALCLIGTAQSCLKQGITQEQALENIQAMIKTLWGIANVVNNPE